MAKTRTRLNKNSKAPKGSYKSSQLKNSGNLAANTNEIGDLQKEVGNRGVHKLITLFEAEGLKTNNLQRKNVLEQVIQRQKRTSDKNIIEQDWENPEQARRSQEVIAKAPQMQEQADALYKSGMYAEAMKIYHDMWIFHNKQNVVSISSYNMGMCFLKMKEYKKAIEFFKGYLDWSGAKKALGNYQIRRAQKAQKAEEENLIKQKWEDPELAKQAQEVIARGETIQAEGDALYKQGKYEDALNKYTLLWSFHNKKNVMYTSAYNIGLCYLKMQDYSKAITFFRDYLQWDGANKALGNYQIRRMQKAQKAEEKNLIKHEWENPELARRSQEVIAKAPQMQEQADTLFKSGKYEEAMKIYHTIWIFHNKQNVVSISSYNMGMCFLKMKDYKKAIEFFKGYLDWDEANKALANYQIRRANAALTTAQ